MTQRVVRQTKSRPAVDLLRFPSIMGNMDEAQGWNDTHDITWNVGSPLVGFILGLREAGNGLLGYRSRVWVVESSSCRDHVSSLRWSFTVSASNFYSSCFNKRETEGNGLWGLEYFHWNYGAAVYDVEVPFKGWATILQASNVVNCCRSPVLRDSSGFSIYDYVLRKLDVSTQRSRRWISRFRISTLFLSSSLSALSEMETAKISSFQCSQLCRATIIFISANCLRLFRIFDLRMHYTSTCRYS